MRYDESIALTSVRFNVRRHFMQPNICAKCSKPTSAPSGSITQWINVCTCDRTDPSTETISTSRCKTCGKPVRAQRAGSLTQWVFQQDGCNCDRPVLEPSQSSAFKQAAFRGFDDNGEVEIEIESGKFPVDRYKPVEILGAGVSGTVYLSRDRILGKRVAVKVLRVLERDALVSFQNEAKTTSKLNHPNIVKVLDFGSTSGGVPFMVMEFVPGISLESAIKDSGGIDFETSVELFIELADALEYAHKSHILHRDLKPSNILVVEEEANLSAHLIDFGVAKLQEHLQTSTIYNGTTLVGTPAYMSPDQALGRNFDERSDIYSLGCIMFETLTGEQVFSAESPLEIIALHAQKQPPSILEYFERTPATEALAEIVESCLEKDRDLRYRNVGELKQALLAVPKQNSTNPKSTGSIATTSSDSRQAVSMPIAGSVVMLLIFAVATLALLLNSPGDPPRRRTKNTSRGSDQAKLEFKISTLMTDSYNAASDPAFSIQTALNDKTIETFVLSNPRIIELSIVSSDISPAGLRQLALLRDLRSLSLSDMPLTREHFRSLVKLSELETLKLRPAGLDQVDLTGLSEMRYSGMKNLLIKAVTVTNRDLRAISRIDFLTHLNLDYCLGLGMARISNIAELKRLNRLSLSHTDATDQTVQNLSQLKQLTNLDLSYSQVSDAVLDEIGRSNTLRRVDLTGCPNIKSQSFKNRPDLKGKSITSGDRTHLKQTFENLF